jgi:hypothetical protein
MVFHDENLYTGILIRSLHSGIFSVFFWNFKFEKFWSLKKRAPWSSSSKITHSVKWPISAHYARPARSSTGADRFALLASSALLARVDLVDQARTAIAAAVTGGGRRKWRIAAAAQATTTTAHCGGRREAVKQSRRPRRATADQNCANWPQRPGPGNLPRSSSREYISKQIRNWSLRAC